MHALKTQLSELRMHYEDGQKQLEDGNQRAMASQRRWEQERRSLGDKARAIQERAESFKQRYEQTRQELDQLHQSLVQQRNMEQSLVADRESKLIQQRKQHESEMKQVQLQHSAQHSNLQMRIDALSGELSSVKSESEAKDEQLKRATDQLQVDAEANCAELDRVAQRESACESRERVLASSERSGIAASIISAQCGVDSRQIKITRDHVRTALTPPTATYIGGLPTVLPQAVIGHGGQASADTAPEPSYKTILNRAVQRALEANMLLRDSALRNSRLQATRIETQ